jgi:hypothetical protein
MALSAEIIDKTMINVRKENTLEVKTELNKTNYAKSLDKAYWIGYRISLQGRNLLLP